MRALPVIALATTAPCASHATSTPTLVGHERPDVDGHALPPLLVAFYDAVGDDPLLAPYFAPLVMAAHVPKLVDFWSTMLFHTGRYAGNAFRPHQSLAGLDSRHFVRWLATFEQTIDARHAGPVAEEMKSIGQRIAYSMQLRLGIIPFAESSIS